MSEPLEVEARESGILRISVRTAAIMLVFTLIFTAMMAATYRATEPRVAASALAEKMRLISEVLTPDSYDNDLIADTITLLPNKMLGLDSPGRAWRARKDGKPVALVLETAAPDGYSGRITLIMAISADGKLIAQRVTAHKETPGLGDYIDPKKDRNKARPWITQFNGLGFDSIPREKWRVKRDGGHFDQMTGATISARAVTNASAKALTWVAEHRNTLLDTATGTRIEMSGKTGAPIGKGATP